MKLFMADINPEKTKLVRRILSRIESKLNKKSIDELKLIENDRVNNESEVPLPPPLFSNESKNTTKGE